MPDHDNDIVERLRVLDASNCMDSDHLHEGLVVDAADEIERLRAELAAAIKQRDEARRDAERYRWLKSNGCYWVEIQSQPHGDYIFKGQACYSFRGSIDAAIDAMLAEMRKGEQDGN